MEFFVDLLEMGVGNMGVNLSSGYVGVAEEGLDRAEVGAVHKEVSCERMTKGVRGDVFSDSRSAGVFFYDALDRARSESAVVSGVVDGVEISGIVEKEGRKRIFANSKIFADAIGGGFGNEDWAIFLAFATHDKFAAFEVDRIAI